MKALHLILIVLFTFTLSLSAAAGNVQAASGKKEITAPADKTDVTAKVAPEEKIRATKASKGIPKDININTAGKEMLVLLPGIGPKTAEAILAYRQNNGDFKNIDELTKVKGIGVKNLAKLKPYLQVI